MAALQSVGLPVFGESHSVDAAPSVLPAFEKLMPFNETARDTLVSSTPLPVMLEMTPPVPSSAIVPASTPSVPVIVKLPAAVLTFCRLIPFAAALALTRRPGHDEYRHAHGHPRCRASARAEPEDAAAAAARGRCDVSARARGGATRAGAALSAAVVTRAQRDGIPARLHGRQFVLSRISAVGGSAARADGENGSVPRLPSPRDSCWFAEAEGVSGGSTCAER